MRHMPLSQSHKRRVVITGASGFIGGHLCRAFRENGFQVVACIMTPEEKVSLPYGVETVISGAIDAYTDWTKVLKNRDVIVHLAARVHVMRESSASPLSEFRKTNTAGTANLARQAAAAGADRLVFMSTVGVNGNDSGNNPYTESDAPQPHNPYSISKYEAEQLLWRISEETGMKVVVVRAPLVYGPGNPGNFLSLLRVVRKGFPLPFASVRNLKSFLYVGNLVSALMLCCSHSASPGNTYLVSDAENVSTPELLRLLADAIGCPSRVFPVHPGIIRAVGRLAGRIDAVDRLLCSLMVDSGKISRDLSWKPPFTLKEGLKKTAEWYIASGG